MKDLARPLPAATERAISIALAVKTSLAERRVDNTLDPLIAAVDRVLAKAGQP